MNDEPGSRYYIYNNDLSKSVIYLINNYQTIKNIAYTEQKNLLQKSISLEKATFQT